MLTQLSFYAAAIPAIILMGLSKGGLAGLGTLSMPLMALVIPPRQAAAITLPILLAQDAVCLWLYRKSWDRAHLRRLLPGAIVGIALAYVLGACVPDAAVALLLGTIAIAFALRHILMPTDAFASPTLVTHSKPAGLFWGSLAGFTSTVAHAGAPPFQIYMLAQKLPRDLFVGTGAAFFAVINLLKVPPYLAIGQLSLESLRTSAVLLPLAIVASWVGARLVRLLPGDRLHHLVQALLFVLGCKLVADGMRWLVL